MGIVTNTYKKNFLHRYDKDGAIPYYSAEDFPGLVCERELFNNSADVQIQYFIYHYDNYEKNKLILFCPGMGPGHTAYLSEINTLCKAGYRILTLDYTGCGESGGEKMTSVNAPTRDAIELLDLLKPQEEIIPIGHSLGGYTALNVVHLREDIKRAVIISGFVSISDEMMGFAKLRLLANSVKSFEKKLDPKYGSVDNSKYLSTTTDKLLWIHSTDDPMVNYKYNAGQVLKCNNPNVRLITCENKKHNPQYTLESLTLMNEWIGEYNRLINEKQLETLEARKAFFADKSIARITEQDPKVYDEILGFIR
ncbi:MAG: alpha/beta fold hydrolase [Clostridiales bacterium]|nr:alpha/beta fold hydrolase [Clostridiales bacterium]